MNTIYTIENALNYFHSHMDKPINAIAVRPNTELRILIKKNNVGLPGFIFYFTFSCIYSDSIFNYRFFLFIKELYNPKLHFILIS